MPKQINPDKSEKFEIVFEKEDSTHIWKYDHTKTKNGPVEVEIKYKKNYIPPSEVKKKTLGDLAKEDREKLKRTKS